MGKQKETPAVSPARFVPPQAGDKRKALEQTMALSTQALASVTCQVSGLASAFLRLLELQAAQLRQVEADITCLAQVGPSGGRGGVGERLWGWGPSVCGSRLGSGGGFLAHL